MEKIINFFTVTVLNFAESNWFWIEIALLALVLLFVIIAICASAKSKKYKKIAKVRQEELTAITTTKEFELKASKEAHLTTEKKLTLSKELVGSLQMEKATLEGNLIEKNATIASVTAELTELKGKYETLDKNYKTAASDLDAKSTEMAQLTIEYDLLKDKADKTEKALLSASQNYKDIDLKYRDALTEIDRLSNYEVENEILLKTIKNFNKEDKTEKTKMEQAIEDLNRKIDAVVTTKTVVVANKVKKSVNSTGMTRKELYAAAKEAGLKNYAIMSSEEIKRQLDNLK